MPQRETWKVLTTRLFAVLAADSPGDGGFPEEARRVLRGSEAVPEERVRPEGLLSVSLTIAPHFHYGSTAAVHHRPPHA